MKIPSVLKVGGHYITIALQDKVENNNDGLWDSRENTIYLNKALPPSQLQATLIHELIHALNIGIEHVEVEFLAQGLFQILADNKLAFDGKETK